MEDLIKELGFESVQEYHRLVASADLSTAEKLKAFEAWKNEDGSKAGLLKLITKQPNETMKWINVNDALPECQPGKWSKDVIVLTKELNVYRLAIQGDIWQRTRSFVEDGNTEVTHWMPLIYPDQQ
jgi:hypothetical protein